MPKKNIELSIVVPFYNEEDNAKNVLKTLAACLEREKIKYEIIAVNNGSVDNTGKVIDEVMGKNIKILKVEIKKNRGYGYGIMKGLSVCKGKYIGYQWGDQNSPNAVLEMFNLLKNKKADICKITRIPRKDSIYRIIQSKIYNSIMKIVFGVKSNDLNGCPKVMKQEVYNSLNISSTDWFIDAEIMIKCKRKGYVIKEIEVSPLSRQSGSSNVDFNTVIEFLINIVKYRISNFK